MITVVVSSQEGGSGKTASAVNLAAALGALDERTRREQRTT